MEKLKKIKINGEFYVSLDYLTDLISKNVSFNMNHLSEIYFSSNIKEVESKTSENTNTEIKNKKGPN